MLGLLRTSLIAARATSAPLPTALALAKKTSLPFIPTDWVFRFLPYLVRDRVRFMYRFNQISFGMGLGYALLYCHTQYKCDHYEGFYESPYNKWKKHQLEKQNLLEE